MAAFEITSHQAMDQKLTFEAGFENSGGGGFGLFLFSLFSFASLCYINFFGSKTMSDRTKVVSPPASSSTPDKIKQFFEDRDWKFYCALAAGVTLAGAGAYYLTQPSSPPPKKKGSSSKKEVKSNKKASDAGR